MMSAAIRGRYRFFCSGLAQRSSALFTNVFCTSTITPADASARESSSTARIASKNFPPAPPYCSGISIPISPSWKNCSISRLSKTPFSSISLARGRTFSSANCRTLSRKRVSSSVSEVMGAGADCKTVSGIGDFRRKTPENSSTGGWIEERALLRFGFRGPAVHQLQRVRLQNSLDLGAGMHRPRPGGVQLYISLPVLERLARLLHFFVSQSQIVVGICIGRSQLQCAQVSLDRVRHAAGFVEHVAKVEVGQSIARINVDGFAIVVFGGVVLLAIVVKGPQIDVSGGVLRIKFQHTLINRDRLQLVSRVFLQANPAGEKLGYISRDLFVRRWRRRMRTSGRRDAGHYFFIAGKIQHELAGNRLEQPAIMTKCNPMPPGHEGACLQQRIFHARGLLLHRGHGLPYLNWSHVARAQVTDFFNLQEIKKGIAIRGREQIGPFPGRQLSCGHAKDPNQIFSAVSIHRQNESATLSEACTAIARTKWCPEEPFLAMTALGWCNLC